VFLPDRIALKYSVRAQQERLEEDLDATDIQEAITGGEILEEYPNDPRGESCLILGYAQGNQFTLLWGGPQEEPGERRC